MERVVTNRLLWLLNAGDGVHLAFEPEPLHWVELTSDDYLVLRSDTQLTILSTRDGTATCSIGSHVILVDDAWLSHVVDLDDVGSQDITADIYTLSEVVEDGSIDCIM